MQNKTAKEKIEDVKRMRKVGFTKKVLNDIEREIDNNENAVFYRLVKDRTKKNNIDKAEIVKIKIDENFLEEIDKLLEKSILFAQITRNEKVDYMPI